MEKSSSLRVMAGDDDEPCIQVSEQRQRTRGTNLHKLRNDSKTIRNQALSIEIPMFYSLRNTPNCGIMVSRIT